MPPTLRLPSYSWTRVKVGLVTSSGSAASRTWAIPFTSVVLPAPRSPRRKSNVGEESKWAISPPMAMVSLLLLLTNRRTVIPAPSTCLGSPATKHNLPGPQFESEMPHRDVRLYPWPAECVDLANVRQNRPPAHEGRRPPRPLRQAAQDTGPAWRRRCRLEYPRSRPWPFPGCR